MSDPTWRVTYDGIEYAVPYPPSPSECGRIAEWTTLRGVELLDALAKYDAQAYAAMIVIAMQRLGIDVKPSAIFDDIGFIEKLNVLNAADDESDPPAEAVAEAAKPPSTTTAILGGDGSPS
jgi:hypothetical protein